LPGIETKRASRQGLMSENDDNKNGLFLGQNGQEAQTTTLANDTPSRTYISEACWGTRWRIPERLCKLPLPNRSPLCPARRLANGTNPSSRRLWRRAWRKIQSDDPSARPSVLLEDVPVQFPNSCRYQVVASIRLIVRCGSGVAALEMKEMKSFFENVRACLNRIGIAMYVEVRVFTIIDDKSSRLRFTYSSFKGAHDSLSSRLRFLTTWFSVHGRHYQPDAETLVRPADMRTRQSHRLR
jgi:hypothetical protein